MDTHCIDTHCIDTYCMDTERILFLTLPQVALPALDRNQRATSHTLELIHQQWPPIESMVKAGQVREGIAQMEALARAMRDRTASDPEPWQEALTLARRAVYENMVHAAEWSGCVDEAYTALKHCYDWDIELRLPLEHLIQQQEMET